MVHFSREQHDLLDVGRRLERGVVKDRRERGSLGQLLHRRGGGREAEDTLGREDDEGFAVLANELTTEDVEVRGGRGDVDEVEVGSKGLCPRQRLVAHLQEALRPRRRVLWACIVVPVREEVGEGARETPLALTRNEEGVDRDLAESAEHEEGGTYLSRVGKISELRLDERQHVGRNVREALLESPNRVLCEGAVDDLECPHTRPRY